MTVWKHPSLDGGAAARSFLRKQEEQRTADQIRSAGVDPATMRALVNDDSAEERERNAERMKRDTEARLKSYGW